MALWARDPPHLSRALPRACRVRAGPYLEDQKTAKSKHLVKETKPCLRGTPGISMGPRGGLGTWTWSVSSRHRGPARFIPSRDQSWGGPAWEEVINYITSSVLLLSKRRCGTDRYQHVSRATDFVYSFVHWLRKFYGNVISSHCSRWSSRALTYDLKSTQGPW